MKTTTRGFIVPLLLIIIVVLVAGGGYYIYSQNKIVATPTTETKADQVAASSTDIEYNMVATDNGTYRYPQIINYENKEIIDKVNQTLSQTYKNFGCGTGDPKEDASDWNVTINVDYAKNDIFSVNESGNYYCGSSPYPTNNYSNTLTFDMKTGEQVSFEKLFANYQKDKQEIINTIYGNVIRETNAYISKNPSDAGNCGSVNTYDNLANGDGQIFRLSSKFGVITIRPSYPHVIEACTPDVEVSVDKLLPFTNSSSILHRI